MATKVIINEGTEGEFAFELQGFRPGHPENFPGMTEFLSSLPDASPMMLASNSNGATILKDAWKNGVEMLSITSTELFS